MENLLGYLSALLLALSSWLGGDMSVSEPVVAEVIEVIDGDTIDVLAEGEEERVRYIGIDTPEFDHETGGVDCYAEEAKSRNEELVLGKEVMLVKDVRERDKYGRLLRYVYVGEDSVGQTLVEEGMAKAVYIQPDVSHYQELKLIEEKARASGAGRWSACQN